MSYKKDLIKIFIVTIFFQINALGQDASSFNLEEVILSKVKNENISLPIITRNNNKEYFVRNLQNSYGCYGGLINTRDNWFIPEELDSFYNSKISHQGVLGFSPEEENFAYVVNKNINKNKPVKFQGIFRIDLEYYATKNLVESKSGELNSFFMDKSCNFLIVSLLSKTNGFGNHDLYILFKNEKGKWSEPVNMGPSINSENSETQPFFDDVNNILYFTSNGHSSTNSSYDIFYSKRLYDSWQVWSNPKNLGEYFNTDMDELFFSLSGSKHGYILRKSVYGKIRVYRFNTDNLNGGIPKENLDYKYLSDLQLQDKIGLTINECIIYFESEETVLNDSNKELLWFIASKLKEQEEINIAIAFPKKFRKNNINLIEKRMQNTLQYLQSLGIGMNKMMIDSDYTEYPIPLSEDSIILMFYTN